MLSRRELIAGGAAATQLRPEAAAAGDGHWQMDFIMSVLVLKLELKDDEIGIAYDR